MCNKNINVKSKRRKNFDEKIEERMEKQRQNKKKRIKYEQTNVCLEMSHWCLSVFYLFIEESNIVCMYSIFHTEVQTNG